MKSVSALVYPMAILGLALLMDVNAGRTDAAEADKPAPLAFKGADIGMSLSEWRAAPIPPGAGNAPERQCLNQYQVAKIPGVALGAKEVRRGVVACTYVQRFGQDILPQSIDLDSGFEAQNLTYLFQRNRLFEIRYKASVDAYPQLRAKLTALFGMPVQTIVSAEPNGGQRKRQTWRAVAGFVTLDDPSADLPALLSVRYTDAAHRPRLGPGVRDVKE